MYTPEHHTVLRAIRDGSPINELPGDRFDLALQLISDGLVHWRGALTAAGTQYLSDVDEPETRRLPRPAPPKLPEGWVKRDTGYSYSRGDVTMSLFLVPDDAVELRQTAQVLEARAALYRYELARRAHEARVLACDESDPSTPQHDATGASGESARAGETSP